MFGLLHCWKCATRYTLCVTSDKAAEHSKSRDSWTSKMPPVVFARVFDTWLFQLTKRRHTHSVYILSRSPFFHFYFGSSFIFFFSLSCVQVSWHFLIETSLSSNVMLRCQCLNSIASVPLHCAIRSQSYDEKRTHPTVRKYIIHQQFFGIHI